MGLREVNRVRRRAIGLLSACFILLFLGQGDFVLHFLGIAQAPMTDYYISLNITRSPDKAYLIYIRNPEFGSAVTGFVHYSSDGVKWSGPLTLSLNPGAGQVVGRQFYAVRQHDFSVFDLDTLLEGKEGTWKSSGKFAFKWPVTLTLGRKEDIRLIGVEAREEDKMFLREAVLAGNSAREAPESYEILKPNRMAACECLGMLCIFYSLPSEERIRFACRNTDGQWEDRGELLIELSRFSCASLGDVIHLIGTPGAGMQADSSTLMHYRLGNDGSIKGVSEFRHGIETFLGQRRPVSELALLSNGEGLVLAVRLGSVIAASAFDGKSWSGFVTMNEMPFATKAVVWGWFASIMGLSLALVATSFQLYRAKRGRLKPAPELESLPVEVSGVLRRFIAFVIDFAVVTLIAFTLVQPSSAFGGGRSMLDAIDLHHPLAIAAIFLMYFALPEALFGQTPGKAVLGVVVRTEDGRKAGIWAAVLRNMFKLHDIFLIVEAFVLLSTEGGRRLGDLAAGTVVARKRAPEGG